MLFGDNNSMGLNVRFTADPGYLVQLYGFDLGGWANTDYTINSVSVFAGGSALFSQNDVLVQGDSTGPGHTAFDFTTPLSGAELLIAIDYGNLAGGQQDNIGIDNIRFGQDPPAVLPPPPAATAEWCRGAVIVAPACRRSRRLADSAPPGRSTRAGIDAGVTRPRRFVRRPWFSFSIGGLLFTVGQV